MFQNTGETALEKTPEQFDLPSADPAFEAITISRCGSVFAKVDPELLEYASRFTWSKQDCKGKLYARADRCPVTGLRLRLYLHHLVANVFDIKPGHPACTHLDHRNGNGLDCRRWNLVWRHPIDNRWGTARWNGTRVRHA